MVIRYVAAARTSIIKRAGCPILLPGIERSLSTLRCRTVD